MFWGILILSVEIYWQILINQAKVASSIDKYPMSETFIVVEEVIIVLVLTQSRFSFL